MNSKSLLVPYTGKQIIYHTELNKIIIISEKERMLDCPSTSEFCKQIVVQ